MSASPDDKDWLSKILYSPEMGMALGMINGAAASRMPVGLAQDISQGIQGAQQFQQSGIEAQQQRLALHNALQGQQYFDSFMGQPSMATDLQPPKPQGLAADLAGAPSTAPISSNPQDMASPVANTAPQVPVSAPPLKPKPALPQLMDPTQDPQYLDLMRQAQVAAHFKMDATPLMSRANARLDMLKNQEVTLTPDQSALLVPGGVAPGTAIKYKPYTGDWSPAGESAIKTVQVMTPGGTMATVPYDMRTSKVNDVGGVLSQKDYSKPLPAAQEDLAQRVAHFQANPPATNSRYPGAADISARADFLMRDYGGLDATTFPSKMAAMKSLTSGKDYQQNSAYSTIQTHMKTLDEVNAALDNGDVQGANKLIQWAGKQFGKSAPQNAKVVNDIVVGELAKVLAQGGQVTDAVRNEAAGDLEPYLSKGQYQGATDYIRQLIAGKMNTSFINARASHIPDEVFLSHLSPEAREQLQIFQAQNGGSQLAGAIPKGWSVVQH